jgi:hypothetical protein
VDADPIIALRHGRHVDLLERLVDDLGIAVRAGVAALEHKRE